MTTIYCVEDEESIRELVSYALKSQNYHTRVFESGADLFEALKTEIPNLLLLDIMLPGEDGLTILQKIRTNPDYKDLPVIMVTAKTSEYDIVKGLDKGADDYISKPFGIIEMISRIRAVLRRSQSKGERQNILSYENVTLNIEKHTVQVDGEPCKLTVKEFELLQYLLTNADIVLRREQIMERVWGFSFEGESRTIDMHIRSLRQKLGEGGKIIQTVRGIGYRIGAEA